MHTHHTYILYIRTTFRPTKKQTIINRRIYLKVFRVHIVMGPDCVLSVLFLFSLLVFVCRSISWSLNQNLVAIVGIVAFRYQEKQKNIAVIRIRVLLNICIYVHTYNVIMINTVTNVSFRLFYKLVEFNTPIPEWYYLLYVWIIIQNMYFLSLIWTLKLFHFIRFRLEVHFTINCNSFCSFCVKQIVEKRNQIRKKI